MKYHGVDNHKRYATVSVRDEAGEPVKFIAREPDFRRYISGLGPEDVVVLEASSGAFTWAERIEAGGARCAVIDAWRFRIIRDSWNKTDRRDAVNLSLALWLAEGNREVRLPEVWRPSPTIRELRQLFGQYQLLNKQIRQLKAQVQGLLTESGITERCTGQALVEHPAGGAELLATLDLPESSRCCIRISLRLLAALVKEKEGLRAEIYRAGLPLEEQVKLLMGIRGVTALLALAFLAEVGETGRFSSLRKLYAYLGVVPGSRSSGGKTRTGRINRQSRALARTLFTQAVPHLVASSPQLQKWYTSLVHQKGYGRARIAVLRRVFGMMRRMLLSGTPYRWLEPELYQKKLKDYQRYLAKAEELKKAG